MSDREEKKKQLRGYPWRISVGTRGKKKSERITIRKAEGERDRKIERQEREAVEEDKAEREAILQLFVFFPPTPSEKFINLCRDRSIILATDISYVRWSLGDRFPFETDRYEAELSGQEGVLRRLVVMYDVVLEIGFRLKRTVMRRNYPDCRAS